ncbi:MAG: hypothetical protein PHW63_01310 [Alphaproteobacteria bacterium]|nr:hypothetical protein [Alphaproteobacteria bacterium]
MTKVSFAYHNGALCVEALPVCELVSEIEPPFLCTSSFRLKQEIAALTRSYKRDLMVSPCYDFKQVTSVATAGLWAAQGCGACVTSSGTIEKAIEAGFRPSAMLLTGYGKSCDDLASALLCETPLLTAGTVGEIELIGAVATALGRMAPVALVCRFETGMGRYGFAVDELADAFGAMTRESHVDFAGFALTLPAARARAEKALYDMAKLVHMIRTQGFAPTSLLLDFEDEAATGTLAGLLGPVATVTACRVHVRLGAVAMQKARLLAARVLRVDSGATGLVAVLDLEVLPKAQDAASPYCTESIGLYPTDPASRMDAVLFVDRRGTPLCSSCVMPVLSRGDVVCLGGFDTALLRDLLQVPEILVSGARFVQVRRRIATAEQTGWEAGFELPVGIDRAA